MRRVAKELGTDTLGKTKFANMSGITEGIWLGKYWASWTNAVNEAGLKPGLMTGAHDKELLLESLAAECAAQLNITQPVFFSLKKSIFRHTTSSAGEFRQISKDDSIDLESNSLIFSKSESDIDIGDVKNNSEEIKNGLDANISGDLLSSDIRAALYHLGEITGEVTNEDKLDFIFSKFLKIP